MSVRPVDFNGMLQNQQEVSNVKQNEDQRPILHQQQALQTVTKQQEQAAHQVQSKEDAKREKYRFDAKDGGKNQYQGDGGKERKRQQKEKAEAGHVRVKGSISGGFDMTV
jgi:hypothetical protein